jgi:hypothetical protein
MVKEKRNNEKNNKERSNNTVIMNQFQILYESNSDESDHDCDGDYETRSEFNDKDEYKFMIPFGYRHGPVAGTFNVEEQNYDSDAESSHDDSEHEYELDTGTDDKYESDAEDEHEFMQPMENKTYNMERNEEKELA